MHNEGRSLMRLDEEHYDNAYSRMFEKYAREYKNE